MHDGEKGIVLDTELLFSSVIEICFQFCIPCYVAFAEYFFKETNGCFTN